MTTVANQRGGFIKTLEISREGSNRSHVMLKNPFLKQSQNYVLQLTKFITNHTPRLNLDDEVVFEILPRGGAGTNVAAATFPAHFREEWRQFRPKPYFSVTDLAFQMVQFFHRFGFKVRKLGAVGIAAQAGVNPLATPVNFVAEDWKVVLGIFINNGWYEMGPVNGGFYEEGRMVGFGFQPDGTVTLTFTPDFSNNFYIRVGPLTQIKTGWPEFLYCNNIGGFQVTYNDFVGPTEGLYVGGQFIAHAAVVDNEEFTTSFSLNSFDERLSIDIQATFPLSNTVTCFNGEEEHEFILCRSPLTDIKRFDTDLLGNEAEIYDVVVISEDISAGLEDLARGNPNVASVYTLPGSIRQVTLTLFSRYFSEGKIKRVETNMDNAFWAVKLLFSKKST